MGKFKEIAIEEQEIRIKILIAAIDYALPENIKEKTSVLTGAFIKGVYSDVAKEYWFNKFKNEQDVEKNKE